MITPTQHAVFSFIHKRIELTGCAPSYQEIADAVKSRSTSNIHRLIVELEQRGYLTRSPGRARGIKLLQLPVNLADSPADPDASIGELGGETSRALLMGNTHRTGVPKGINQKSGPRESATSLSSSAETPKRHLHTEILLTILGRDDHFSMVVNDDVMKRDGILNGDTVIVHRCEKASNGTIVAVTIEGKNTLRRMVSRGKRVTLESSDPRQEMLILPVDRLRIQGRMVVLVRDC